MKNPITLLLLVAVCSVSVVPSFGQSMPAIGKTSIFLPKKIHSKGSGGLTKYSDAQMIAKDKNFGQTDPSNKQNEYWDAFSDREKNPAYTTSTGNTVANYLNFNQKVTIADIDYSSRRALVYLDKRGERTWPSLPIDPNKYTCYGWVKMDCLLLWPTCPVDDKGIYNKALLTLNLDAGTKFTEEDAQTYYLSPNASSGKKKNLDEQIYYIMKREGDKVLLSNQYTLDAASNQVLKGWWKSISYVEWNQRSCLEPTWDQDAVSYFSSQKINARIIEDKKDGKRGSYWDFETSKSMQSKNNKTYNNNPEFPYRIPGSTRRFPILKRNDKGDYLVTSFSRTKKGSEKIGVGANDMWGKTQEELRSLQNINLVLLIDGTKSMEPFYEPVRLGLEDGCKSLTNIKNARIKVGAVIYRDAKDIQGGQSYEIEKLRQMVPPKDASLATFLKNGGEYGIRSSSADKTMEESLFKGIEASLEYFKGKDKESNILLVVGDCGNLKDDARQSAIIDGLVKANVQLMAYQVRLTNSSSYGAFVDQMFDVFSKSLKGIYAKQKKETKFEIKENKYTIKTPDPAKSSHQGSVITPLDGKSMQSKELKDYLFAGIYDSQTAIQHQIDAIVGAAYGDITANTDTGFLESRGISTAVQGPVSFRGWATKTDANSGYDFYKSVLFLSQEELKTLVWELGKVPTGGKAVAQADRMAYVNAMKEIVARHIGESASDIAKMSMDDINALLYGINVGDESFGSIKAISKKKKIKLEDILYPEIVSDADFLKLLDSFRKKYDKLRKIKSDYQGYYEFNNAKYYWLPVEILP